MKHFAPETQTIIVLQWQRCKVRRSVVLGKHLGFLIFSEIVLLFFDFFVTGSTYDNRTRTYAQKKITVHYSIAFLFPFKYS